MRYQVYELDVWAGEEEGSWTVNNVYKTDNFITIDDDASHSDIYEQLAGLGYNCNSDSDEVFEIVWNEDFIEIVDKETGRYELQLWAIGE